MKRRVALASSAISLAVYDDEARTLEVHFRDGGSYLYFDVPLFTCEALGAAESAGKFWNRVKEHYRCEQLD